MKRDRFGRFKKKYRTARKMSKRAAATIARKVRKLRDEGYPVKQSVAIAYAYARRHGFKIPRRKRRR